MVIERVACLVVLVVLVALDAARIASHPRVRFITSRAVVLASGAFLLAVAGLELGGGLMRDRWGSAKAYRFPSGSIFPTLLIGDPIYVDVGAFGRRDPRSTCLKRSPTGPDSSIGSRSLESPA
jgi:hypothetical protein